MKRSLRITAIRFVALLIGLMSVLIELVSGAYAASITLVAKLTGANEVPAVNTPGTGKAVVVLDTAFDGNMGRPTALTPFVISDLCS